MQQKPVTFIFVHPTKQQSQHQEILELVQLQLQVFQTNIQIGLMFRLRYLEVILNFMSMQMVVCKYTQLL